MEDAQEKAFTKRKRSEEEFEETQEHVQECQARASALDLKINQFTELLQLVTARDREEKPPEMSWINHFEILLKTELPSCPEIFKEKDLAFPTLLLEIGKHMGFLSKEYTKAKNALKRAEKKQNSQERKVKTQKARIEKKAQKVLSKDSVEHQENEKVRKYLCLPNMKPFFWLQCLKWIWDLVWCYVRTPKYQTQEGKFPSLPCSGFWRFYSVSGGVFCWSIKGWFHVKGHWLSPYSFGHFTPSKENILKCISGSLDHFHFCYLMSLSTIPDSPLSAITKACEIITY